MDPERRSLLTAMLAGIALLGPDADVAEREPSDPSVYIPKAHLVQDRAFLHAFMDEFSFVDSTVCDRHRSARRKVQAVPGAAGARQGGGAAEAGRLPRAVAARVHGALLPDGAEVARPLRAARIVKG
jgi:hypothetical protein